MRKRTADHIVWARDRQAEARRAAASQAASAAQAQQPPWPTVAPRAAPPPGALAKAHRKTRAAAGDTRSPSSRRPDSTSP
ncbi:MAG: hypothetical protein QE285_01375 [Aquabacterium sp.]|nr:hypothetical protein [Aquabacterium sp.]